MALTTSNIVSIIPARGGSKGLPRKNVQMLAGKKLIGWTIEASLGAKMVTRTVVSSDDIEILSYASEYDVECISRPSELATDTASSESVILHSIEHLELKHSDTLVLLQPTSPLRNAAHIDAALQSFTTSICDSLISVKSMDNKILKGFYENGDGFIVPLSDPAFPFMARQQLPKTFMSNGAIYIVNVGNFVKTGSLMSQRTGYFLMDDAESADIDTQYDLENIENTLQSMQR
ncbi:acylneuraminate cytidylyltransferase family protein [Alteromonas sediminis]|uniref:Acylneuraminate cytidylyltransferase family protein n=1 Tax=Alteromonas sediminis TaxID=2259342 RepID=A0A3N5Z7W9_9ALTE|nr:acylneuraminate cytidylyltransferase family protein [Alteromonas sediminis]RPJ64988.1 acylneuraminate cytidylyltransferase family protein [Alteromonas sediminis]